jgi:hypothetical protein
MVRVAALFVDPRGPYPYMPTVECWGLPERDAREYSGPYPVVAHPPCGPWGRLRHLYRGDEHNCAPIAAYQVRRHGGVLEHPAGSLLWEAAAFALPLPGEPVDRYGGFTVEVRQVDWGHVAEKKTWLYFVGVDPRVIKFPLPGKKATHCISRDAKRKSSKLLRASKAACRRTPPVFARWLVDLAATATVS